MPSSYKEFIRILQRLLPHNRLAYKLWDSSLKSQCKIITATLPSLPLRKTNNIGLGGRFTHKKQKTLEIVENPLTRRYLSNRRFEIKQQTSKIISNLFHLSLKINWVCVFNCFNQSESCLWSGKSYFFRAETGL